MKAGFWKKVGAVLLAFVLVCSNLTPIIGSTYASDEGLQQEESTTDVVIPTSGQDISVQSVDEEESSPSDVKLNLQWGYSKFTNGSELHIVEPNSVVNYITMKVNYSCERVREEGYGAGELIITVKGIGQVKRTGVFEAVVGADKRDSSMKVRDWSYTYNPASDTYTLRNNKDIRPNSVLSGYFEIVWAIDSRASKNGYSQDNIVASLSLPDGTMVSSNSLVFINNTKADACNVEITRRSMYSDEGLTENIENPDDYAFIRYELESWDTQYSRGLKSSYYTFNPDSLGVATGEAKPIVISPSMKCTDNGDGTYTVELGSHNHVFVAYPKSSYTGTTVTASLSRYGVHHEGDDSGNTETYLLATNQLEVPIPADFKFSDITSEEFGRFNRYLGSCAYYFSKSSNSSYMRGSSLVSGTTVGFTLHGGYLRIYGDEDVSQMVEDSVDSMGMQVSTKAHTLEIMDDFMYIQKNNGDYRTLDPSEYSFKSVTIPSTGSLLNINEIPIAKGVYPVYVYAFPAGVEKDTSNPDYLVFEGTLQDHSQEVTLPDGTASIDIVVANLVETVNDMDIPVYINYHIKDTSDLPTEEQDNLTSGRLSNTAYIKVYDGYGNWLNSTWTQFNYLDDETSIDMAQRDIDTYNEYLDREDGTIYFYEPVYVDIGDYSSYSDLSEITYDGERATTKLTIGGRFHFLETSPDKFSMYTILDEYLSLHWFRNPEDIWDVMTLSGFGLDADVLATHCIAEVDEDYRGSGRTYIALHFDFSDLEMPQDGSISATFDTIVDSEVLKASYSIYARSCVMMDRAIEEPLPNRSKDIGAWGGFTELFSDIDNDGDTSEPLSASSSYRSDVYAASSQLALTKYAETTYSDGPSQRTPYEEYEGTYKYVLYLENGNSTSSNIVVRDILESGENSQWHGSFVSVDLSDCEKDGLLGTVYYSSVANPSEDLTSADWSTEKPEVVTAIAVDFGDSVLPDSSSLKIEVTMKAPLDESLEGMVTENYFSSSFTQYDLSTGNETKIDDLTSNSVQIELGKKLRDVVVKKVDSTDKAPISGAVFELKETATGKSYGEVTSNSGGYAIFRRVPANTTYTLVEKVAPMGYQEATVEETVELAEETLYVTVENERLKGRIEVRKVNNLDNRLGVSGATYTLFGEDGAKVATSVTDADGVAVFENVLWGNYTVKETISPKGYILNEKVYSVSVNRKTVVHTLVVSTENVQEDTYVHLNKYETQVDGTQTDIPIFGAVFELYSVNNGESEYKDLYITDNDGRIDVSNLPYGEYYFHEYRTPKGYLSSEDVYFTLSPDQREVTVNVYNQRKPGRVITSKEDNLGNTVVGAEYTLYADDLVTVVGTCLTNEYGIAEFSDLEWGTYYLKETNAPEYYQIDDTITTVVVHPSTKGAIIQDSVSIYFNMVNETVKGSVSFTKTDEAGLILLPNAEYCLYESNGSVMGTYRTDENGNFVVTGLEWGSYYFKEVVAPEGYGLSDETIRFTVNSSNACITQELTATDPIDAKALKVTKRISADNINFDNGNPTFMFEFDGVDIHGQSHSYSRIISFDKDYVANNTNSEGYVEQSILIGGLIAGRYTIKEADSSRYYLKSIENAVNAEIVGEVVVADLVNNQDASVTFVNERYEEQDYSDGQNAMNVLKSKAKLTGISAYYNEKVVEPGSDVNYDLLHVLAIYDDGSTITLDKSQYELSRTWFPLLNGTYTIDVTHTENGIERHDGFEVTVDGGKLKLTLKRGREMNTFFSTTAPKRWGVNPVKIVFSDKLAPEGTDTYDVSKEQDGSILAWMEGDTAIISSQISGVKVYANADSRYMFDYDYGYGGSINATSIDVSMLDVSDVTDMYYMFKSPVLEEIVGLSTWDTSNVQRMERMFYYCSKLSDFSELHDWNVSSVSNMKEMFQNCSKLENLSFLENWNTSNVLNLSGMFSSCKYLTNVNSLAEWDVSKAQDMGSMFAYCSRLEDINGLAKWNTHSVTNMGSMFRNCSKLQTLDILSEWSDKLGSVKSLSYMFDRCTGLTNVDGLANWDLPNVTGLNGVFQNCSNLVNINGLANWKTPSVNSMVGMFASCTKLEDISGLSTWNVSTATNISELFYYCYSLKNIDSLANWNVSKVQNMSSVFSECSNLTSVSNLSKWDTSSVTSMEDMFFSCNKLESLAGLEDWNVSMVTSMYNMFYGCNLLTNLDVLNKWVTSSLTNTSRMFYNCRGLLNIDGLSSWDVSKLSSMYEMFYGCIGLVNVDGLATWGDKLLNVQSMNSLFSGCSNLVDLSGLTGWDVSNVKSMNAMFSDCSSLTDLSYIANWNVSSVTDMSSMFNSCLKITDLGYIANWNVSSVTDMSSMFSACKAITNVDSLVTWADMLSTVTNMSNMFYNCTSLSDLSGLSSWSMPNVIYMGSMFAGCTSLTNLNDLTNWNLPKVTTLSNIFSSCINLTDISAISTWSIPSVTTMSGMFASCSSLEDISCLSSLDMTNVTAISYMFRDCTKLSDISSLASWNIANVTSLSELFRDCSSLTNVDALSTWDISNVTTFSSMFNNCSSLENINGLSSWNTSNVTNMSSMFRNCGLLSDVSGLVNWDVSKVTSTQNMFYDCGSLTVIDLSNWNIVKLTNYSRMRYMFSGCSGITEAYAKTQAYADKLNNRTVNPYSWKFTVKSA